MESTIGHKVERGNPTDEEIAETVASIRDAYNARKLRRVRKELRKKQKAAAAKAAFDALLGIIARRIVVAARDSLERCEPYEVSTENIRVMLDMDHLTRDHKELISSRIKAMLPMCGGTWHGDVLNIWLKDD